MERSSLSHARFGIRVFMFAGLRNSLIRRDTKLMLRERPSIFFLPFAAVVQSAALRAPLDAKT